MVAVTISKEEYPTFAKIYPGYRGFRTYDISPLPGEEEMHTKERGERLLAPMATSPSSPVPPLCILKLGAAHEYRLKTIGQYSPPNREDFDSEHKYTNAVFRYRKEYQKKLDSLSGKSVLLPHWVLVTAAWVDDGRVFHDAVWEEQEEYYTFPTMKQSRGGATSEDSGW